MSSKPLVPSKDALRVLRSLAQSPSAAFVGTASALCGIAAVHYHEQQRIRVAQRILETKRKLHSITKGKGSARLALMFEAAERGEDFSIRGCRHQRSPGRREYSVASVKAPSDNDAEWKPFPESDGGATADPTESDQRNYNDSNQPEPSKTKTSLNFGQRPLKKELKSQSNAWDISDIYKESRIRGKERRRHPSSTWHETMQQAKHTITQVPVHVKRALGDHGEKSVEALEALKEPTKREPFAPPSMGSVDQPVTDLNPIETDPIFSLSKQSANLTKPDLRTSILLNPDASGFYGLSSLQPWHTVTGSIAIKETNCEPKVQLQDLAQDFDFYLSSSADVPDVTPQHGFRSRYNLSNPKVRHGMSVVGVHRYRYVFENLMNFRQQHGTDASLVLLERIMHGYTITGLRSDFALVQALFLDCTWLFTTSDLRSIVHQYVESFLHGDTPRLEVVSFLYPRCGAGASPEDQHYYFLAQQYLETINERGYSSDRQVIELRKVLAGTSMLGIELHEHLVLPALRSFCSAGRMTAAQALFDEATSVYQVNATFYSQQVLIRGYAKAGNFSKVKMILDGCHSMGLSHQKAYGVSGLLSSIINDYADVQSPERVVDFITYCIGEYGIQPVSSITRQIICLCLRHRRYDLVIRWVNMIRTDFPHIEIGTSSNTFAFDISRVWKDINASCDDILDGCRAIASQSLRDPFSKTFRSSASEAVARYIEPKLRELRAALGKDVPEVLTGEVDDFYAAVIQLKNHKATDLKESRLKLLLNDLLSQAKALRWLNMLLRGQLQAKEYADGVLQVEKTGMANAEKPLRLPAFTELRDTLMEEYEQRYRAGQSIEHERLRSLAARLVQQDRAPHAFNLIQDIYDSRWAQPPAGREFDIEVFADWLKLASDLKSGSKVRSVLWAILDAGPQLKLNSNIVLLARIAAPKTHLRKAKRARSFEVEEVEYLRLRLRRRFWSASSGKSTLKFDEWRGIGSLHVQHEDDY